MAQSPAHVSRLSEVGKYDMVCSVTQQSLNSTMKEYLSRGDFPEVIACYYMRKKTPTQPAGLEYISYKDLMTKTDNTDPFNIANGSDPDEADIKKLRAVSFRCAMKFRMGWPEALDMDQYSVLNLDDADVNNVRYNMFCSEFQIVEYRADEDAPEWFNLSQTSAAPWVLTAQVSLVMDRVDENSLPEEVKKALERIGSSSSLSVQQLLFDLNKAVMKTIPTIVGLPLKSTARDMLKENFLGPYFDDMKSKGQPILYIGAIDTEEDPSELRPTDMQRAVSAYRGSNPPDKQALTTLNYLCMAFQNKWPGRTELPWDWVGPEDSQQIQGVMAINRNTFATWFIQFLKKRVKANIYKPWTTAWWQVGKGVLFDADLVPWGSNVDPEFKISKTGDSEVMAYEWSMRDDSSKMGHAIALEPSYKVTVSFLSGSQIKITQRLACWFKIEGMVTSTNSNIIDKNVTDTYTLYVDGYDGSLKYKYNPGKIEDIGKMPSTSIWQDLLEGNSMDKIAETLLSSLVQNIKFESLPMAELQSFMFPGGKVFAFSNVRFSDNQDLLASLTYASPAQIQARHALPPLK